MDSGYNKVSLTFYNENEDKYGDTTAKPNPDGNFKAIQGVTIAVDPSIIPYGSWVHIPALQHLSRWKDGLFYAHDTGSAVKQKVSSHARGNDYPVIDVFVNSVTGKLSDLNGKFGYVVEYKIINT